ncbi:c6 zinc finger domain containing protein [Niveomyces insectorum RCEF 264]|uniref:C6 zinc finger domain containing protein n=1 Tax=Niveomyces insectorum RCEF 264 TaxID=1081102 RepID=A0A167TD83_9HYPO|nr:c6 zinc finger domain containing protein [Niveomyces insectorum RCEF 264]
MDDVSSPNSSSLSVFDTGNGNDVLMHDDEELSPFSSTNDNGPSYTHRDGDSIRSSISSAASARPVMLLPATEKVGATADATAAQPTDGNAATATSTPGPRKRRTKKAGEKKDDGASSATAGSDGATAGAAAATTNAAGKVIKRRAARACVSCRNRKVRRGLFNARETAGSIPGAEAVVHNHEGHNHVHGHGHGPGPGPGPGHGLVNGTNGGIGGHGYLNGFTLGGGADAANGAGSGLNQVNGSGAYFDFAGQQRLGGNALLLPKGPPPTHTGPADPGSVPVGLPGFPLLPVNGLLGDPQQQVAAMLPGFIRPLPGKMAPEDIVYLHSKGAFTLPDQTLQKALLHAFVEFVYPYMPLLELRPFLETIHERDGKNGTISLLLYHAVMFTAAAFVPAKYLKAAGFSRRREARKTFFMKARALYDFDYEMDRFTLVQSLLLMTYWYETPEDQKDTWHWMGVAVSLAHTIGLHRDPRTTGETLRRQRLRKLLWWCCFMRDRMIALGMRRPKRIRSEDADVPMLTPGDFDQTVLPDEIDVVPAACRLVRDVDMQAQLAELCVEKAKLCVLVGSMLQQQYTILPRGRLRGSDAGLIGWRCPGPAATRP